MVWSHSENGSTGSDEPASWEPRGVDAPEDVSWHCVAPVRLESVLFWGEMVFVDDFTTDRSAFWSFIHFFFLLYLTTE